MTDAGWYVYAVSRGLSDQDVASLTGIRSAQLSLVTSRGLDAVVSPVDLDEFGDEGLQRNLDQLDWLEQVARSHDDVIHAVYSVAPSAPLRLATICLTIDSVKRLLDEWHDALTAALDRVEGRDEWSVKLVLAADLRSKSTVPAPTEVDDRPGAAYLQRRKAESQEVKRLAAESEALAEELHKELSGAAVASSELALQDARLSGHTGRMILNGAYLVDRERAQMFIELANRLAAAHPHLHVDVQGPWPPYSFATLGKT